MNVAYIPGPGGIDYESNKQVNIFRSPVLSHRGSMKSLKNSTINSVSLFNLHKSVIPSQTQAQQK